MNQSPAGESPGTDSSPAAAAPKESSAEVPGVEEFGSDRDYFEWLGSHPDGYVLNVRGKKILLHRASCTHIDRHNNPGTLTERGAKKFGADRRETLAKWARQRGSASGSILPKCPSCF